MLKKTLTLQLTLTIVTAMILISVYSVLGLKSQNISKLSYNLSRKTSTFFHTLTDWFENFSKTIDKSYAQRIKQMGHCVAIPGSHELFGNYNIYLIHKSQAPPPHLMHKLPKGGFVLEDQTLFLIKKFDHETNIVLTCNENDFLIKLKQAIGIKDANISLVTKAMLVANHDTVSKAISFHQPLPILSGDMINKNQICGLTITINKGHLYNLPDIIANNLWIFIIGITMLIILLLMLIYDRSLSKYVQNKFTDLQQAKNLENHIYQDLRENNDRKETLQAENSPDDLSNDKPITLDSQYSLKQEAYSMREAFWCSYYAQLHEKIQISQEILTIVRENLVKKEEKQLVDMMFTAQRWILNPVLSFIKPKNPTSEKFFLSESLEIAYKMWADKIDNFSSLQFSFPQRMKISGNQNLFIFAFSSLLGTIVEKFQHPQLESTLSINANLVNDHSKFILQTQNILTPTKSQSNHEFLTPANKDGDTIPTRKINLLRKSSAFMESTLYTPSEFLRFSCDLAAVVELFEKIGISLVIQQWEESKVTIELLFHSKPEKI